MSPILSPRTSRFWPLLGKELRQLLPLALLLPLVLVAGVPLFLFGQQLIYVPSGIRWELLYQLLGLVFAVGAVGLLVSQEKETRTLTWLAGLPISPLEIVRCKLWAGALGVTTVWLLSIGSAWALQSVLPIAFQPEQWLLSWVMNLYVLTAGLAIVWRFDSIFISLILVLVVAFLPAGFVQAAYGLVALQLVPAIDQRYSELATLMLHFLSYGVLGGVSFRWLQRWGVQALSAQRVKSSPIHCGWQPYLVPRISLPNWLPVSPGAALTWQFCRQNSWALWAVAAVYVSALGVGSLGFRAATLEAGASSFGVVSLAFGLLATSWLGVVTFGGDAYRGQIRFLADRGLSRWQVWWTRQSIPIAMISTYCLASMVVVHFAFPMAAGWWLQMGGLLLVGVAVIFSVYSISQWLGQQIHSPILASILAPPVSVSGTLLLVWLLQGIAVSLAWLWLFVGLVSLGVWRLTPAWMDQRLRRWDAVRQLSLVSAVGALIVVPSFWSLFNPPDLSPAVSLEMEAFSRQTGFHPLGSESLRSSPWYRAGRSLAPAAQPVLAAADVAQVRNFREEVLEQVKRIEGNLAGAERPLSKDLFLSEGLLLELVADLLPHWAADQPDWQRLYNRVIGAYFALVKRLRLSPRLDDQGAADLGEIWLLRRLLQPQNTPTLADDLHDEMVAYLQNHEARQLARRKAVFFCYQVVRDRPASDWLFAEYLEIGGAYFSASAGWSARIGRQGRAIRMLELLWALSSGPAGNHAPVLRELAENQRQPVEFYGQGKLGEYFRVEDVLGVVPDRQALTFGMVPVGQQWSAGWEQQTQQLKLRQPMSSPIPQPADHVEELP
jgi:hypothetical protein